MGFPRGQVIGTGELREGRPLLAEGISGKDFLGKEDSSVLLAAAVMLSCF